ncbi:hypothetical protein VHUM_01915 [Vanrija humicola]|uniref:Major facilitator superfamily (MFS) profile domain-containing protein n=1 Tax=Vanrija humicola TaxID=5417 RepID=A0A7D8ZSM9_VANHU|nr:hypothetical protein VHUM_01915 [Vanrija humicola]
MTRTPSAHESERTLTRTSGLGLDKADTAALEKRAASRDSANADADAEAQTTSNGDIYDRFSPRTKAWIVAIVSYAGFIGPIASSSFLPSISIMADDLHTTPAVINYTVAIFIVSVAVAPIFWSPLAGFYGRKPVYLASMPIMVVASVGVAQSKSLGAIIGTRILQGIGSSCVLSVGAGTIGDLYRPTERANAMAWFYTGTLLGPALSPILAGIFTQYTALTWRATQYFLCAASALSLILLTVFFPETSHPPLPHDTAKKATGKKFVVYWFNPARSLLLLRYPNITMITIASSCVMLQMYCVVVPLATIMKEEYGVENAAIAGLIYLASGAGTLLGSRISGPYADYTVRKWMEKRGYRRPEDRLRASLVGAGIVQPLSGLAYGWILWSRRGGLAPICIMLFINGAGMLMPLTAYNTYLVDSAQKRSAEAIAVNNFWRYIFAAGASAAVLPLSKAVGFGWTMTIAAGLGWIGVAAAIVTLVYGEKWREAAARRFGTADDEKEDETEGGRAPESAAAIAAAGEENSLGRVLSHAAGRDVPPPPTPVHRDSADDHSEHEHGEPSHLPAIKDGLRRTPSRGAPVARTRSRPSTLPTVGEVLQRSTSLGGGSIHGGG